MNRLSLPWLEQDKDLAITGSGEGHIQGTKLVPAMGREIYTSDIVDYVVLSSLISPLLCSEIFVLELHQHYSSPTLPLLPLRFILRSSIR